MIAQIPISLVLYTYPILIFLAILIPIPLLDDWVAALFRRNFIKSLAGQYQIKLSLSEIRELADRQDSASMNFLVKVLTFRPVRKLLKSAFYVFEIPRAFEELSRSFYYGYLMNVVFRDGWYSENDLEKTHKLRSVVFQITNHANLNLVTSAAKTTFRGSKNILQAEAFHLFRVVQHELKIRSGNLVIRLLHRGNSNKQAILRQAVADRIEQAIAEDQAENREQIRKLAVNLKDEITKMASGHLANLEKKLVDELVLIELGV